MNIRSVSSSESLVDFNINGKLMAQQLMDILVCLVAESHQSSPGLISTTAIAQISYWIVCLDKTHPKLICLLIRKAKTLICMQNRNVHNRPSGLLKNRPRKRCSLCKRCFGSGNRSLINNRTLWRGKSENPEQRRSLSRFFFWILTKSLRR